MRRLLTVAAALLVLPLAACGGSDGGDEAGRERGSVATPEGAVGAMSPSERSDDGGDGDDANGEDDAQPPTGATEGDRGQGDNAGEWPSEADIRWLVGPDPDPGMDARVLRNLALLKAFGLQADLVHIDPALGEDPTYISKAREQCEALARGIPNPGRAAAERFSTPCHQVSVADGRRISALLAKHHCP